MTDRELVIDGRRIADNEKAYVIGDVGHNHAGSMGKLKAMVLSAKESGVDAVKFQTRHPKEVYAPHEYYRKSDNVQWMDETYGIHREKLEWSRDEWKYIFDFCSEVGITAFSTPFDFRSLDLLVGLDVPAIKIASGDATNLPLIEKASEVGVPLIISTGGTTQEEVDEIVETMEKSGTPFALLQCSCIYPAPHDVLNLSAISTFRERYPSITTGLSTHDPESHPTLAGFALGGRIFEHHYTNNRRWKGTDNSFSLTPPMMKLLRRQLDDLSDAMGSGEKQPDPREASYTLERRKSLYWSDSGISIMCPGGGIEPKFYEQLNDTPPMQPITVGAAVKWSDFE